MAEHSFLLVLLSLVLLDLPDLLGVAGVVGEGRDDTGGDVVVQGVLLLVSLGLLHGDNLAVLEGDLGLHVVAVRSLLAELLAELEPELHGLEGGGGFDGPIASFLRNLGDGGGGGGCLPQQHNFRGFSAWPPRFGLFGVGFARVVV